MTGPDLKTITDLAKINQTNSALSQIESMAKIHHAPVALDHTKMINALTKSCLPANHFDFSAAIAKRMIPQPFLDLKSISMIQPQVPLISSAFVQNKAWMQQMESIAALTQRLPVMPPTVAKFAEPFASFQNSWLSSHVDRIAAMTKMMPSIPSSINIMNNHFSGLQEKLLISQSGIMAAMAANSIGGDLSNLITTGKMLADFQKEFDPISLVDIAGLTSKYDSIGGFSDPIEKLSLIDFDPMPGLQDIFGSQSIVLDPAVLSFCSLHHFVSLGINDLTTNLSLAEEIISETEFELPQSIIKVVHAVRTRLNHCVSSHERLDNTPLSVIYDDGPQAATAYFELLDIPKQLLRLAALLDDVFIDLSE
ncbi:MAG: hypothetical protein P4L53_28135 [Candidatus Obscuribacterales bacterium]|nr:hypothetical protein [Candidatus Obscuribacterales bacterium]